MPFDFAVVGIFLIAAFAIVGIALLLGRFVRPAKPDPVKSLTYECGERPIGSGWFNFNPRFYQLALLFLAILVAALAFLWGRGDLDWVRDLGVMPHEEDAPAADAAKTPEAE